MSDAIPPRSEWTPVVTQATIIRTWRDQVIDVATDLDGDVLVGFPHGDATVFLTPADARALAIALNDAANQADEANR